MTGREADDGEGDFYQAPITNERQRLSDGSWLDEPPEREDAPDILAAQANIRHVPEGTQLRSDTPRGLRTRCRRTS